MALTLGFGLNEAIPPGARAAWGARWIFPADQLWDRQSCQGSDEERAELLAWLNGGAAAQARAAMQALAEGYLLAREDNRAVILHHDEDGVIVANPRASHGYVYVVAFMDAHVPEGAHVEGEHAAALLEALTAKRAEREQEWKREEARSQAAARRRRARVGR